jgi:hypothetical protein
MDIHAKVEIHNPNFHEKQSLLSLSITLTTVQQIFVFCSLKAGNMLLYKHSFIDSLSFS